MFIAPQGPQLTSAQALELDDDYFRSSPFGYFSARIHALISASDVPEADITAGLGSEFSALLGLEAGQGLLRFTESDRQLQIATDSFAVRHHAAEALVRLYHALTAPPPSDGSFPCVWAAITNGPLKTVDLVKKASAHLNSAAGHDSFWTLVLPASAANRPDQAREITTALNVMGDWLTHAMNLLVRDDVSTNSANNKVKHGLAVRSRNDTRVTLTTVRPNPDGTVPLSSLTGKGAIDILDSVSLAYLSRPPSQSRKQGLEISALNLSPPRLLAETWMMTNTLGCMFHIAAAHHFGGREAAIAEYPRLPLRPTPTQLLGDSVVGMRFPITSPPDGGELDRKAGVAFQSAFVPMDIDILNNTTTTVVEG